MSVTTAAPSSPEMGCKTKLSCYSSVTAGLIVLRFGILLGTHSVRCTVYGTVYGSQICSVVQSLFVTRFSHVMGHISHCGLHMRACTTHICISGTAWPIALKFVCAFVTQSAVTQSVCAVGGLRGWRFARLAVCAVGGLRGWRFARLAVCAVGGLRGWRFARLAVCAVGSWRG